MDGFKSSIFSIASFNHIDCLLNMVGFLYMTGADISRSRTHHVRPFISTDVKLMRDIKKRARESQYTSSAILLP